MWLGKTSHEVGTEVVNKEDHHSDGKRRGEPQKLGGVDRREQGGHGPTDGEVTGVESVDTGEGNHRREPRGKVTQEGG